MDKHLVKNYENIRKNKFNKKKQKYSNHRNKTPLHKPARNYVNSYIKHNKYRILGVFCIISICVYIVMKIRIKMIVS